ncbi:uncharacterized protein LOC128662556 [Bombina bombina]|uniref:uncharacterized protein LOC128662556 n=1 Tax=Bombina bombina TaxID=8345 RepID=UPI00235A9AB0|nr:uncharacterized protein LOC128662556 [Bombina bombina]
MMSSLASNLLIHLVINLVTLKTSYGDIRLTRGIEDEEVLLPCFTTYKSEFKLTHLVVNWQQENDEVVHSFYYGKDQPQYQHEVFLGRTQLFPQEFPKGNLSLLLKALRTSDSGMYVCYVFLDDAKGFHTEWAQLEVKENSNILIRSNGLIYLSLLSVLLVFLPFVWLFYHHKRRKLNRKAPQELEPLLGNYDPKDMIEQYREFIQKASKPCCKSVSHGQDGSDDCLPRTLILPEWRSQCTNSKDSSLSNKSQDKIDVIPSELLFTKGNMMFTARRMLIAGEAGIGKSCFTKGLQKKWVFRDTELFYECVIYFTAAELKSIINPISVNELLGNKCKELKPALPQLLQSDRLLIILDGLDEMNLLGKPNHKVKHIDHDTAFDIESLIINILFKDLLPNTDVLVTSVVSSLDSISMYFDEIFIMQEFSEEQVKQYCNKFCSGDEISQSVFTFIKEHNLSSLASIPLLSSALCELFKYKMLPEYKEKIFTPSRMMMSLLKCCLNNIMSEINSEEDTRCCIKGDTNTPLSANIKRCIYNLAKLSYENLIDDGKYINKSDLGEGCAHTQLLTDNLCKFFFKPPTSKEVLEYRHASFRDMFAALYCVWELQDPKDIMESLISWFNGRIPAQPAHRFITVKMPQINNETLQKFLRFFFGLLGFRDIDNLQEMDVSPDLLKMIILFRSNLPQYTLNFCHYLYEIHNNSLIEDLPGRSLSLLCKSLNSLDIQALQYSSRVLQLDTFDLSLCELGDEKLQQLESTIINSRDVRLISNKLTWKSGRTVRNALEDQTCKIKCADLFSNNLGSSGAQEIWKALEKNKSLETLNLSLNEINDEGTEGMVQSLSRNTTLKRLLLCMNRFSEKGTKAIEELGRIRKDLKVILNITEDLECYNHVLQTAKGLTNGGWKLYNTTWILNLLSKLQENLNENEKMPLMKKIISLKTEISKAEKPDVCSELSVTGCSTEVPSFATRDLYFSHIMT